VLKPSLILFLFVCWAGVCKAQELISGLDGPASIRVAFLINQATQYINEPLPLNATWVDFYNRGERGRLALKEINKLSNLYSIKGYASYVVDSLEEATLGLLASAVVATKDDVSKIKSLKKLGAFYLDNERKGDSVFIKKIETDLELLNYRLPHFGIAVQGGTGLGINQFVEVGVLLGWEYHANRRLGEYYHFNGISFGAEYAVGKAISAFKLGYQASIKAPFYWGIYYLPLGSFGAPDLQNPGNSINKSIGFLGRLEVGLATPYLSLGLGLTATLVNKSTPEPMQTSIRKAANILDFRIRFQVSSLLRMAMKNKTVYRNALYKGFER